MKSAALGGAGAFVVLLVLSGLWFGLGGGGFGPGGFGPDRAGNDKNGSKNQSVTNETNVLPSEYNDATTVTVYLGKNGVSADKKKWFENRGMEEMIENYQVNGIKLIHYVLLDDSIPRHEERWQEALEKTGMKAAEIKQ